MQLNTSTLYVLTAYSTRKYVLQLIRLVARPPDHWLSVTTVKDLEMTAGAEGLTCFLKCHHGHPYKD